MSFQDEMRKSLRTPEEATNSEVDAYVRHDFERMKQRLRYAASSGEYDDYNGCKVVKTVIESEIRRYCRISFKEEIVRKGIWGKDFSIYHIATCSYADMKLVNLYLRKLREKTDMEGIKFEVFATYFDRTSRTEYICSIPGQMRIKSPGNVPVKICMKVSMKIK